MFLRPQILIRCDPTVAKRRCSSRPRNFTVRISLISLIKARRFMPIARSCFLIVMLIDTIEQEGLLGQAGDDPLFDPEFNTEGMKKRCPELFLLGHFYHNATRTTAKVHYAQTLTIVRSMDVPRIAGRFLQCNQELKSSLHRWLAMPEYTRVKALGRILTQKRPGDDPVTMAETLDLQAQRLAATWIDWDKAF